MKEQLAALADADQVTRAVGARARRVRGRRQRTEALVGELALVQVAARQARAADEELAAFAARDRASILVEDVQLVAAQRAADGDQLARRALGDRGVDGRLRRAVDIQHASARRCPARDRFGRAALAADDQQPHRRQRVRVIIASDVGTVEKTVTLPPATSSARFVAKLDRVRVRDH